MKKLLLLFLVFCLFVPNKVSAMEISAKSAVLYEHTLGRTLFEKNAAERLPMASTTKIMTALLAVESGKLHEEVIVSPKAANVEGSSMYLKPGEKMPLLDLVYGLMLSSGNDAAIAIAEFLAESEEDFSKIMTSRAHALGCVNTNFCNASGLPDENHYTTATDLARITGKALENETFREIVQKKDMKIGDRYLKNHNKLLSMYEGTIGVKTGFTKASGRTLVSAAERNGVMLIAVTLHAPDDWNDHIKMLDMGFSMLQKKEVLHMGDLAGMLPLQNAQQKEIPMLIKDSFSLPLAETDKIEIKYLPHESIEFPILEGDTIGTAEVYVNAVKTGELPLCAGMGAEKTKEANFLEKLRFVIWRWASLL